MSSKILVDVLKLMTRKGVIQIGNFNKVLLLGNLCADPEVKFSAEGNAFCQVGMATNRKWTDRNTGEVKEEVCFVDIKAFGRTAEIMGEYLRKGSPAFIEGRLSYYRWDDDEGNPHSKHSVVVESLQMLGKNGAEDPATEQTQPGEKPEAPQAETEPMSSSAKSEVLESTESEDEIPFN